MYENYNPNPAAARVGDCVIRAIAKATNQTWEMVYIELALYGFMLSDLPSANHVWGKFLKEHGFVREIIPTDCPDCYTVKRFCEDHKIGTYILAISGHVVTVVDGNYYDTWDSGDEVPIYYWKRSGG